MQEQKLNDLLTKAIEESKSEGKITLEIPVNVLWIMIAELQRNTETPQIDPDRKAGMFLVYTFLHYHVEPKLPTHIKKMVQWGWQQFGIRFTKKKVRRKNGKQIN